MQPTIKHKLPEEPVSENEELLQLALHLGKMYWYEWDAAKDVVMRTQECRSVLSATEPIRVNRERLLERVHPDDRPRFNAAFAQLSSENPSIQIRYRMLFPNGVVIWLEENGRAFFARGGRMRRMIGVVADVTERKQAEEALSTVRRKLVEAQEQERTRIARDLHDEVAQRLALFAVELEELQRAVSDWPPRASTLLYELRLQLLELSNTVHEISHDLHSLTLTYLGTAAAMREFCRGLAERQKVEIDFESHGVPEKLPSDVSLPLFRVLQEALNNAVKHSGVKHFDVKLWGTGDAIDLTVQDFGAGFDVEAARQDRGLGLTSMQERLRLVNGELSIESHPRGGTTVHAHVNLSSPGQAAAA